MEYIITAMIGLALFIVIGGYFLSTYTLKIRRQSLEQARKWQEEHYDLSWYDEIGKEDYTVIGYEDYVLHAQRLVNPAGAKRCVLISHGYTDNRYGALKYAKMYLDLGFHVIIYDLRGHGENEKTFCTFSVREGKDLDALVRDSRARWPEAEILGLHGESLGAATSVACLKYDPPVDFVVSDCAFSEIIPVMKHLRRMAHKRENLVDTASIFTKVWYGYMLDEMRPIEGLDNSEVPILFLHGEKDSLVLPENSEELSKAAKGYHELHLIPEAGHAESVLTAPEEYREHVESFLKTIGVL